MSFAVTLFAELWKDGYPVKFPTLSKERRRVGHPVVLFSHPSQNQGRMGHPSNDPRLTTIYG